MSSADFIATRAGAWHSISATGDLPQLEDRQLHLFAFDLADVSAKVIDGGLDQGDRLRGARIHDANKRRLYLGGRFGLKFLLSLYTGLAVDDLQFDYGSRGKPALRGGDIRFNYTLSRDKVLYAFAADREVGVDMEVLPRRVNAVHMANTRLTATERSAWRALPDAQRNNGMLSCWTRKEAYGKTIGVGIRFRLGAVNLFHQLDRDGWTTPLAGLFETTDRTGMPDELEGIQLGLPFDAVASVMFSRIENCESPALHTMQLFPDTESRQ